MPELFWFLVGCAVTIAVTLMVAASASERARKPRRRTSAPPRPPTTRITIGETRPLEELSEILGEELANLVSGVEGHAQLLCESLSQPQLLEEHSTQLWEATRRMRFFSEKLQSYARVPQLPMEPTNVGHLLAALVLEIQEYSRGSLQVNLNTAPSLPYASAHPATLRTAILLLLESVLELEPNASTLLFQAQAEGSGNDALHVRVDIEAVLDEGVEPAKGTRPGVQFSYLAARNLLAAQDARFSLDQTRGLNVLASITLLATQSSSVLEPIGEPVGEPVGEYGDEGYEREAELFEQVGEEIAESVSVPLPTTAPDSTSSDGVSDPIPEEIPDGVPADPLRPVAADSPHQFGGVLIMEGNPMIRDMLCRELRRTERNIISCSDGLAAHSLFDATPERFELLILEQDSRRERGDEIAAHALALRPSLKVIMLTPGPGAVLDPTLASARQLRILPKPFGMMELRESLADALGPAIRLDDEASTCPA